MTSAVRVPIRTLCVEGMGNKLKKRDGEGGRIKNPKKNSNVILE